MKYAAALLCVLFALPARAETEVWTAVLFAQLANQREVVTIVESMPFPSIKDCDQGARVGLSAVVSVAPPGAFQMISTACYEGHPDEFEGVTGVLPELPTIKKPPTPITIDPQDLGTTG